MYSENENPPVAKMPFVLGDLALLATAGLLAWAGPRPLDAATLLGIVACVALGAVLLAVPFLLDYSRRQEQLADERQATIERLVQTAAAAAEQASIAAGSLHTLARDTAEILSAPRPSPCLPEMPDPRPELQTLRQQLAGLAKQLNIPPPSPVATMPPELGQRLDQLADGLRALQATLATLPATPVTPPASAPPAEPPPPEPKKPRRTAAKREPAADTPPLFVEGLLNADISLRENDATPLLSALGNDSNPPLSPPPPEAEVEESPPPPAEYQPPPPTSPAPRSPTPAATPKARYPKSAPATTTGDGTTRLTVTAYIGIGNKLYVRGEGPGLSTSEGVPLQFVSIGKWRWETEAATAPLKVSVWKNDEQRCEVLGEFELAPGQAHEVTADF